MVYAPIAAATIAIATTPTVTLPVSVMPLPVSGGRSGRDGGDSERTGTPRRASTARASGSTRRMDPGPNLEEPMVISAGSSPVAG